MYLRLAHTDLNLPTLYKFIRSNPLGILTTAISSPTYPLIQCSHIPWVLDCPNPSETELPTARLRGHMARANPQTKALIEAATTAGTSKLEQEVMVLFNGPVHHYVTPKFYVETKPSTGKVVPTWDYSAVQIYGLATLHFDTSVASTGSYLTTQINDLSRQSEEEIFGFTGENGRAKAWTVDEAPESYVNVMKKAIIGIEIEITRMEGKFKMSQELAEGDRKGVIEGFRKLDTDLGREIAATVKERSEMKNVKRS